MNITSQTLKDLADADFVLTRFNPKVEEVGDLDILVRDRDFADIVRRLETRGYELRSHDQALGGRIKGAQVNLFKKGRVPIDLHKDFTWRAKRYLDLDLIWQKKPLIDYFLVFINVIFEKTYLDQEDFDFVWKYKDKVFQSEPFYRQSQKYGWARTFITFRRWNPNAKRLPLFLPLGLVLLSYYEKFHLISLLYYLFFRIRYLINETLPYD